MRAISTWQPWASAIALREKRIETRHWSTDYRGPIAIHAAQRWTKDQHRIALELGMHATLPLGQIIAVAKLIDCRPTEELLKKIDREEYVRGNYAPGRFGWILESVWALKKAVDWKGRQSFFTVPDMVLADQAPAWCFR